MKLILNNEVVGNMRILHGNLFIEATTTSTDPKQKKKIYFKDSEMQMVQPIIGWISLSEIRQARFG